MSNYSFNLLTFRLSALRKANGDTLPTLVSGFEWLPREDWMFSDNAPGLFVTALKLRGGEEYGFALDLGRIDITTFLHLGDALTEAVIAGAMREGIVSDLPKLLDGYNWLSQKDWRLTLESGLLLVAAIERNETLHWLKFESEQFEGFPRLDDLDMAIVHVVTLAAIREGIALESGQPLAGAPQGDGLGELLPQHDDIALPIVAQSGEAPQLGDPDGHPSSSSDAEPEKA